MLYATYYQSYHQSSIHTVQEAVIIIKGRMASVWASHWNPLSTPSQYVETCHQGSKLSQLSPGRPLAHFLTWLSHPFPTWTADSYITSYPFAHSLFITLMMEAVRICETSLCFSVTTWHYIPEDSKLHTHCCENLKSHMTKHCLGYGSSASFSGLLKLFQIVKVVLFYVGPEVKIMGCQVWWTWWP
jgi:hypothetical protein